MQEGRLCMGEVQLSRKFAFSASARLVSFGRCQADLPFSWESAPVLLSCVCV
jgi:hypothetical protein